VALTAMTIAAANRIPLASSLVEPSTQAIDATNGNTIVAPAEGWDRVVLRIVNTTAATKVVTIAAGAGTHALNAGKLDISMAQNEIRYVPLSPSAKYVQADGSITITYAAGTTGTVQPLVLPVGM